VGLFALRYPIVQLLFQRGAFKESSTEAVVWALQFYALGLFAHAVVEIVTRTFYALHDTLTPVLIGVGAMGINVVLSLILIRSLAHGGLALANSTATILEMVGLLLLIRRRLEGLEGSHARAERPHRGRGRDSPRGGDLFRGYAALGLGGGEGAVADGVEEMIALLKVVW
jgi:putative peptidoglycan lipid II flippase